MIKKFLAIICTLSVLITATVGFSSATSTMNQLSCADISLEDLSRVSNQNINILTLSPENISEIENYSTVDQLMNFLSNDGIVVYRNDDGFPLPVLDSYFNLMSQEVSSPENIINSQSNADHGKDIATIYYLDIYGMISTHTINVSTDNTCDQKSYDELVQNAIYQIITNRNNPNMPVQHSTASKISGVYLGSKTYTYTRTPKGKLVVDYEFYSAQNVNGENYFLVFCDINGIPGAVLYADDSSYEKQYQGEEMVVDISPITTSVTLDDYGPDRTITYSSVSYSVDVGTSLSDVSFSRSTSYSRTIYDTEISTKCTSTDARWEIAIRDPAQSDNCRFEPAATFVCPSAKRSVQINCYASYTLDSFFTAQEKISLDRTITCTLNSISGG